MATILPQIRKRLRRLKREFILATQNSIYYQVKRKNGSKRNLVNNGEIRKSVCFIVQRTEIFSSVQSVFDAVTSNKQFDVTLLVLPRFDHGKNTLDIGTLAKNIEYCKNLGKNVEIINGFTSDGSCNTDVFKRKFHYIFLGLPYQREYGSEFNFERLAMMGRLCYVPYGSSYADGDQMIHVSIPNPLLLHVDYFFADCEKVYRYAENKLKLCANYDNKKIVYNVGFPRFDLIKRIDKENNYVRSFLWLPRWTTSLDNNEKSTFLENKNIFIDFFENHPDYQLIIRPHPLMFQHYIDTGVMSAAEVEKFKKNIEKSCNIILDENASYLDSFEDADCLIADYSSIVIEFFVTGKPIIYLNHVDLIEPQVSDGFYVSDSSSETIHFIEQLVLGEDEKKEYRSKIIKQDEYRRGVDQRIVATLMN